MRVLHTISDLSINSGGPSLSTWTLVSGMRDLDLTAEILTFLPSPKSLPMISHDPFIHGLPPPWYPRFGYSRSVKLFLQTKPFDLYHGHGLWQYPVHAMACEALKNHKPYIISTRGMLHPEALKKSTLFKRSALKLFQKSDLVKASALHATSLQEVEIIRALKLKNPIALIPNPIYIKSTESTYSNHNIFRVGFIGRLVPIKNLETLLRAWRVIETAYHDIELVIMGDGSDKYKSELVALAKDLDLNRISFTGFLAGMERDKVLSSFSILVLPSKSENFGMVVPEALVRGIPVVASKGTPWEELNTHNAGWWIDFGVDPLVKALREALSITESERQILGMNGRRLIENKYSTESISKQMIALYNWILNKRSQPDFVYT